MTAPDAHNRSTPGNAPVTVPESDALDAWLESITSPRHGGRPLRHVERSRDISPNGHIDPATSLQATAKQFHARLTIAEREAEPDVPADAIWEKIMASTTLSSTAADRISTHNVACRAAELVSNGVARSTHPDTTRTIPAWLAGSHWAVSAFMLAAVVVGIVALYGSFAGSPGGSGNDPATNPNFAMASPGETVTTLEPDIDRWLADPSSVDCERDPSGSVDSSTWATDRPKSAENYLPFVPVSPEEGLELADRWWYLNANCAPTAEDPFVTDDFGWMQGLPFGNPTADQIASAQEISAALPMQDYESYYIIREATTAATPDGYAGPTGRAVLLPNDVVQLADGRLGGPLRLHIQTDDPTFAVPDVTGGPEAAGTMFVVFEKVDGLWLYDEQFTVCVGDCESFWADSGDWYDLPEPNIEATPVGATPSASTDWLAPVSPDECNLAETRELGEVGAITENPGQIAPREYSPATGLEESVAQDVAGANRAWEACNAQGLIGERRAHESLRYIAEIQPYDVVHPQNSESYDDWVAQHEAMRAAFLDPDAESYFVESEALPRFDSETGYGETELPAQMSFEVIQPHHLVLLPDGRIAGPVTSLEGPGFLQWLETRPPALSSGYQVTYIHIFAPDPTRDNRWALDEQLWICVSGCDAYYAEYAFLFPASPVVATPSVDAAWVTPITADECDVEPLANAEVAAITRGEPGDDAARSYAPTGPFDAALAQDIAEADRTWQSCYVNGSAGQRAALQTPRFTRDGPGVLPGFEQNEQDFLAQLERFDATRELGDSMLSGDWQDYFIESDLFDDGPSVPLQIIDFIATVPNPEQAVQLADGRVAVPIVELLPSNAYPFTLADADEIPYWYIEVHILAQDPARDGRWVFDESIGVCMGDCDLARADTVEYMEYLGIVIDEATPVASPRARHEGQAA